MQLCHVQAIQLQGSHCLLDSWSCLTLAVVFRATLLPNRSRTRGSRPRGMSCHTSSATAPTRSNLSDGLCLHSGAKHRQVQTSMTRALMTGFAAPCETASAPRAICTPLLVMQADPEVHGARQADTQHTGFRRLQLLQVTEVRAANPHAHYLHIVLRQCSCK